MANEKLGFCEEAAGVSYSGSAGIGPDRLVRVIPRARSSAGGGRVCVSDQTLFV